jgi:hypothetical protein
LRRRKRAGVPLDDLLPEVVPGHPVWLRSDYGRTIDLLEAAGLLPQSRLIVCESLFDAQTTDALSDWLGLSRIAPRPEARVNAARGEDLTAEQLAGLRARLEPIYADLKTRDLPDSARAWWWT